MCEKQQQDLPLSELVKAIHAADDTQIRLVIDAVIERFARMYPDWEILFCSLPKNDPEARRIHAQRLIDYLRQTTP